MFFYGFMFSARPLVGSVEYCAFVVVGKVLDVPFSLAFWALLFPMLSS